MSDMTDASNRTAPPETVTVTDRRQDAPGPQGHQRARGRDAARRRRSRSSATTPACRRRRCAASAWSTSRGSPSSVPSCYTPVADGMEVHDRLDRACSTSRASRCSSSRWSTTRSTARSATRRASARCRSMYFDWDAQARASTTAQGPQGQGRRPRPAHRARPGALHPVHALHPRLRRGGQGTTSSRWRTAAITRCSPPRPGSARQPLLAQHRRRLPGRRADREGLPLRDARLGARTRRRRSAPGCATGCNVEVHHSRGAIYRLVPRAEPGGQQVLDVRRGPLHLQGDRRATALAAPRVGGVPRRLGQGAGDRRRAARARRSTPTRPGRRGAVARRRTNEDNYALAKLAKALGIAHVYLAGRPPKPERADDILRRADVNPNTAGARAIGGAGAKGTPQLDADDRRRQRCAALLVLGDARSCSATRRSARAAASSRRSS